MSEHRTTKQAKEAAGTPIETSSPTGQEELEQHTASEDKGDAEVPEVRNRRRNPPVHTADLPEYKNPKRTDQSPRTDPD